MSDKLQFVAARMIVSLRRPRQTEVCRTFQRKAQPGGSPARRLRSPISEKSFLFVCLARRDDRLGILILLGYGIRGVVRLARFNHWSSHNPLVVIAAAVYLRLTLD